MEDDKTNQITALLSSFDKRDEVLTTLNEEIYNQLRATAMRALLKLFQLPPKDVEWLEVEVEDDMLLMAVQIQYQPEKCESSFVKKLTPAEVPEGLTHVQRTVRVGIPVDKVFDHSDDLLAYLTSVGNDIGSTEDLEPIITAGFDQTALTHEQVTSMIYFQQTTRGIKQ